MPAYDYRCVSCETVFEVVRAARDTTVVACPACGGATKRIFTPVGVHYKGTGFHSTDYGTRTKEPASEAPACPAAKSGACEGCATEK